MDIRQTLQRFQAIQTDNLSYEDALALKMEIEGSLKEISDIRGQIQGLIKPLEGIIFQTIHAKALEKERMLTEELEGRGFKKGALFYIDKHDGLYEFAHNSIYDMSFKRHMPDIIWPSIRKYKIDSTYIERLMPIKTEGPFEIGDVVTRDGQEYTVAGYLGIRMALEYKRFGQKVYKIVRAKDQKTFRSLLI